MLHVDRNILHLEDTIWFKKLTLIILKEVHGGLEGQELHAARVTVVKISPVTREYRKIDREKRNLKAIGIRKLFFFFF